jgi:hypothetical protein
MSDPPTEQVDRPRLYDAFDEKGRAWLQDIVRAFNEGTYRQAVDALVADEAAAPGAVDE